MNVKRIFQPCRGCFGVPSDVLGAIFDEFRQVEGSAQRHRGSSLGLAIYRRLSEVLGGSISVESEVGKGTTFTVRIPMTYRET